MIERYLYDSDHAKRYAHMSEDERKLYPDAVEFSGGRIWRRTKKLSEMTAEDRRRYGPDGVPFAAVDVPVSQAEKWFAR